MKESSEKYRLIFELKRKYLIFFRSFQIYEPCTFTVFTNHDDRKICLFFFTVHCVFISSSLHSARFKYSKYKKNSNNTNEIERKKKAPKFHEI